MNSLDALASAFGSALILDKDRRQRYEVPERGAPGYCPAVLVVRSEDEIERALELANAEDFGFVLSAGRTGLVEAQRPEGELVLSLEKLARLCAIELASGQRFALPEGLSQDQARDALFAWWEAQGRPDLEGSLVHAQAGLAVDALNDMLAPLDRMFPMEMGSTATASIGACVANASAGANAVCYGTAAHMARESFGFWGNGSLAGPCSAEPWRTPDGDQVAIDSTRLPEAWGLAGSQGAFGVITRVVLRTQSVPRSREAVLLAVDGMPQAMDIFKKARQRFAQDVEEFEFLSRVAVSLVLRHQPGVRLPFDQEPNAPYLILLQVKSAKEDEDLATKLYEFCSEDAGLADEAIAYAPLAALKKIRHSVTESSNLEMRDAGGGRLTFDTATPVSRFGEYLDKLAVSIRAMEAGWQLVDFGHAGVGGAHLHVIGSRHRPVTGEAAEVIRTVFDVTQAFGGTFSAEHGVGPKWGEAFVARSAPGRIDALIDRKRRFDPNNVLSPRSFGFAQLLSR